MPHYPDFATFSKLASTADYVPVYRRVLSDVLTPVSAFHKIDDGGSACLFESVIGGEKVGRYSFLAAEPFMTVESRGKGLAVCNHPPKRIEPVGSNVQIELDEEVFYSAEADWSPLTKLRELVQE